MSSVESILSILQFVMHIGEHLGEYGPWTYGILSLIIFAETAFVIFPFLPGDTLLFTAGAFCAGGNLNLILLNALIISAAIIGNTINFWIGRYLVTVMDVRSSKWIDQNALTKTHSFFEKHGGKTIVLARFLPVIRSFAPFVAGISKMDAGKFQIFNVIGAVVWSGLLTLCGYFFGNLPFIRDNLNIIVLVGVGAAIIPLLLAGVINLVRRILKKQV